MKIRIIYISHFITMLSYHLINVYCLGYSLIALAMEFNSIFLHIRKLLKLYGYKSSDIEYKINSILNLMTFIIFRFGVQIYILIDIFLFNHRLSSNYFILLLLCYSSMGIMNIGIFYLLVIKDFLKLFNFKSKSKKIEAEDNKIISDSSVDHLKVN